MTLKETFDSLTAGHIRQWIDSRQEEHLQLEFKTVRAQAFSNREDRTVLGRCISGFANSSGGIIVWGVDARPGEDGTDVAQSAAEITGLRFFHSRLIEFSSQATSPIVDGVEHKLLETSNDTGFVATLVPEGAGGPYMAKLGDDRYYKRSGAQFRRLEHFDLEDMFGRRQRPKLSLTVLSRFAVDNPDHEELVLSFLNEGRSVARHFGWFAHLDGVNIVGAQGNVHNVTQLNDGRPTFSFSNDVGVIHPNGVSHQCGQIRFQRLGQDQQVRLSIRYYCEHMMPQNFEEIIPVPVREQRQ